MTMTYMDFVIIVAWLPPFKHYFFYKTCKNSNWGEEGLLDCLKILQASLWETVNSSKDTIVVPPCHCSNCTSKPVQIKRKQTSMHFQG